MTANKVSIIIPTYNRAHLIGQTLESVLAQSYHNWECLVVDDGSTDYTLELLKFYSNKDRRIKYFQRPEEQKSGANSCRNIGLEKCTGDLVYFFDSDDILNPEILGAAVNIYAADPELDFIFFNYKVFEGSIANVILHQRNASSNPFEDYLKGKINLATPAVLWKKITIDEIKFNEDLKKSQELEFIFKLFKQKKDIRGQYLDLDGFLLRKHDSSIVHSFHDFQPGFLFSDIFVRYTILQSFTEDKNREIYAYNKRMLQNSFKNFLLNANFNDCYSILNKTECSARTRWEILFYKLIYTTTSRDFRLNKAIGKLFLEDFHIKVYQ